MRYFTIRRRSSSEIHLPCWTISRLNLVSSGVAGHGEFASCALPGHFSKIRIRSSRKALHASAVSKDCNIRQLPKGAAGSRVWRMHASVAPAAHARESGLSLKGGTSRYTTRASAAAWRRFIERQFTLSRERRRVMSAERDPSGLLDSRILGDCGPRNRPVSDQMISQTIKSGLA